jgi:endonuclease/exonuclease/phosphatase family metal-dependent hydrolase
MAIELKVMSFNSRIAVKSDGVNYFWNRTERILSMIRAEDPDIIGLQEVSGEMREWYVDHLDDYTVVGIGRQKDYSGESTAIAFKKRLFWLISADSLMLSSTPHVQGTFYEGTDQSRCPRIYTKLLLKHRALDEPFWIYNLHTDHQGPIARQMACMQVLQDMSAQRFPAIVTGDFNALPDAPEIRLFTASAACPLVDTTESLGGTFHNYGRITEKWKIDYVFASPTLRVLRSAAVEDEGVDGVYLSDHQPIYTVFAMGDADENV